MTAGPSRSSWMHRGDGDRSSGPSAVDRSLPITPPGGAAPRPRRPTISPVAAIAAPARPRTRWAAAPSPESARARQAPAASRRSTGTRAEPEPRIIGRVADQHDGAVAEPRGPAQPMRDERAADAGRAVARRDGQRPEHEGRHAAAFDVPEAQRAHHGAAVRRDEAQPSAGRRPSRRRSQVLAKRDGPKLASSSASRARRPAGARRAGGTRGGGRRAAAAGGESARPWMSPRSTRQGGLKAGFRISLSDEPSKLDAPVGAGRRGNGGRGDRFRRSAGPASRRAPVRSRRT